MERRKKETNKTVTVHSLLHSDSHPKIRKSTFISPTPVLIPSSFLSPMLPPSSLVSLSLPCTFLFFLPFNLHSSSSSCFASSPMSPSSYFPHWFPFLYLPPSLFLLPLNPFPAPSSSSSTPTFSYAPILPHSHCLLFFTPPSSRPAPPPRPSRPPVPLLAAAAGASASEPSSSWPPSARTQSFSRNAPLMRRDTTTAVNYWGFRFI